MVTSTKVIEERKAFIYINDKQKNGNIACDKDSLAGVVSQRACVYCGARVVLNPITDAAHIVHGPIGCASYTWDIRGSLSSSEELYRHSFSTDLQSKDIIFGGEEKLTKAIDEIVEKVKPKVIFIYATCVVGVIGDDIKAVCKVAEEKHNIRVIPVQSEGFSGNKTTGYKQACNAIISLMENCPTPNKKVPNSINYLGDFNLAAETWILNGYFKRMGIKVLNTITGDSNTDKIKMAPTASYNIVQCSGSMVYLANAMKEKYNIPYKRVRFFGISDTVKSLRKLAYMIGDKQIIDNTEKFIKEKLKETEEKLQPYKEKVLGKRVAIYVGGGFKAISLIQQFNELGIETVVVGTQTGRKEEYEKIKALTKEGTIILDDTNPSELEKYIKETKAQILVGGVKERPLAYKLGLAFIDHNHERKHPLCGFEGAINFAKEVDMTVNSPVWQLINTDI